MLKALCLTLILFSVAPTHAKYEEFKLERRVVDGKELICKLEGKVSQCLPPALDLTESSDENPVTLKSFDLVQSLIQTRELIEFDPVNIPDSFFVKNDLATIAAYMLEEDFVVSALADLKNIDKVEIRDVATPVNIMQLFSDIDSANFDPNLVSVSEDFIEFPIYFNIFWKPNTGSGPRPSVQTFVEGVVKISRKTEPTGPKFMTPLTDLNFSELNLIQTYGRRAMIAYATKSLAPDEKTQKIIDQTIAPLVGELVFKAQWVRLWYTELKKLNSTLQ
jgi:hypothetical protein